jgi:hypothetical protein
MWDGAPEDSGINPEKEGPIGGIGGIGPTLLSVPGRTSAVRPAC